MDANQMKFIPTLETNLKKTFCRTVPRLEQAVENEALDLRDDPALATERENGTEESLHCRQVRVNLSLFHKLWDHRDSTRAHVSATVDRNWFKNPLSAGFAENESILFYERDEDFLRRRRCASAQSPTKVGSRS